MEYNHLEYVRKYFSIYYITYSNMFSKKELDSLVMKISNEVRKKYNDIGLVRRGGADKYISSIVNKYMNDNHQKARTNYINLKNYVTKYVYANNIIKYSDKTLNILVELMCSMLMPSYNYNKMMSGNMDSEIALCYKLSLRDLSKGVHDYVVKYALEKVFLLVDIGEEKLANVVNKIIMTSKKINVTDLFFDRYEKLINEIVDFYNNENSKAKDNNKSKAIEYIKSRILYKTQSLELLNQIIDRIYFSLSDMGLTSKDIMSGQYDGKIRELYYEYHFNSVDISIEDNSIQKEGVPTKIKKNSKKANIPQSVSYLLIVAALLELLNLGIKDINDVKKMNEVKKNLFKIDGYGYHQIDTIHDRDFSKTVNNLMDTYDEYSMFDNPNFDYINFYRAYCSVTENKMYVMDNMFEQIKNKVRNNNTYSDLRKDIRYNSCFLDFMYDRLEEMGYEEIREQKYFDLLNDYVNIRNKHPYSNPVEYLTDYQEKLLDKVCKKYEELSQQYYVELGLFLDENFDIENYSNSGGRK